MTRSLKFFLFIFLISLLGACKSEPAYKTVVVDFFIQHPELSIIPATFDTLEEVVLVREAALTGATFEAVNEQVLLRDSYRSISIMDIQYVNMLADQEKNLVCAVPCITYYSAQNYKRFEVQAEYMVRSVEVVAENGTGAELPAEYETREFYRTRTNASINLEPAETLEPLRKVFRIPNEMDFDIYWQQELLEHGMLGCGETLTYAVVE